VSRREEVREGKEKEVVEELRRRRYRRRLRRK
jgi:hypothetical protein